MGPAVYGSARSGGSHRSTRQLLRDEQEVHLEPKIRDSLWPDTFVSESGLTGLIAQVREALGDDRQHFRYIRTVHGFGCALSASVAEPAAKANDEDGSWSRAA
jgi:DNA-binding winged helix-turn-helix (wHTH) protein